MSTSSKKSRSKASPAIKPTNDFVRYYPLISGAIIVVMAVVIVALLMFKSPSAPGTSVVKKEGAVKAEFYVMSQCPYGTQVEDAFAPVYQKMSDVIDLKLDYIVDEPTPGVFRALHGEPEVKGNIVQLCARSLSEEKFMDFIVCQNKDARSVDTNWEGCAAQVGIDLAALRSCYEGDQGLSLLRESMARAKERGASASPTIYFNDAPYNGARDPISFQREVCKYVEHSSCDEIPACASDADCTAEPEKEGTCNNANTKEAYCTYKDPVKFEVVVLNDKKCSSCDTTNILSATKRLFLGAQPRDVDVSSAEGKKLVEQYGIEVVPAYIFDAQVAQTNSWSTVQGLPQAFEMINGKYKLQDSVTGASYFVSEEARAAFYDNIGVKKGDNKPQIDFFVMSYCPFGNQAEEGIAPVYELLGDKAVFRPHYVIYSNYAGGGPNYCLPGDEICSMHGIQELNQNIREACAYKYEGTKAWFDFALEMNSKCTSQNADTCWESVAKGLGLDVERIKTCEKNEGEALMRADLELGEKLGVSGSPTVFVDGDSYDGARNPESYKLALCGSFENQPSECSTKLAGDVAAPAATAQC